VCAVSRKSLEEADQYAIDVLKKTPKKVVFVNPGAVRIARSRDQAAMLSVDATKRRASG
jgi:hypothetical protein